MIDINTKFITLIGTPLSQSLAAEMQNAAYDAADLNMRYFYTEADSTHLREIIEGVRRMPSFMGCAVTKPNKVEVLPYLDALDPLCEKMGACNTVIKQADGTLKGYNTDGSGFLRSLKDEGGVDPAGKRIFCLGAGGAGRAIASVLAYNGIEKIYINSVMGTEDLVRDINTHFAPVAEGVDVEDFSKALECDIIINATGIGMGHTAGTSPMPAEYMAADKLYFDACYNPEKTTFLEYAEAKGGRILNGLGMSIYQGIAQIELWTGKQLASDQVWDRMRDTIRRKGMTGGSVSQGYVNKK